MKNGTTTRGLSVIPDDDKMKDDSAINLISQLNDLIEQAIEARLGTAARILATAKEDLVYWVADLNFEESPKEMFINEHLLGIKEPSFS